LPATTFAEPKSKDRGNELKTFQKQLDEADIAAPVEREKIEKIGEYEVKFEGKDKKVKVDLKNKKIKINEKEDLQIELSGELNYEQVDDKILGYDIEGNLQNYIENVSGGFRMVINITKSNKKNYSYDFPLLAKNGEKYIDKENGEFWLVNEKGERLYIVMKPWANDSNGKSLKTWYTIEKKGTVLRQNIDLKDASFPVVADPAWCGYYIYSASWKTYINGDDRDTLSITPSWCGRWMAENYWQIAAPYIWEELQIRYPYPFTTAVCSVGYCSITAKESMRNQLYCHVNFVGAYKDQWNVEPWRPNVAWYNLRMLTWSRIYIPNVGYGWQCNPY